MLIVVRAHDFHFHTHQVTVLWVKSQSLSQSNPQVLCNLHQLNDHGDQVNACYKGLLARVKGILAESAGHAKDE